MQTIDLPTPQDGSRVRSELTLETWLRVPRRHCLGHGGRDYLCVVRAKATSAAFGPPPVAMTTNCRPERVR